MQQALKPNSLRPLALQALLAALGLAALLVRPSPDWVERSFSNGYYPQWQAFWAAVAAPFPFALGDIVIGAGILAMLVVLIRGIFGARRSALRFVRSIFVAAAVAGFLSVWFYAGWGWGYDRAPLETRVAFDAGHLNRVVIDALEKRAIREINLLAPAAHAAYAGSGEIGSIDSLRVAWLPVVQRLGDHWSPNVFAAKPAIAGLVMDKSGTSGFTNPFTLETQLAPHSLWFERPFSQAHEWSHVAGFNREDEANYIAALTCLRDGDPIAQYSGWLELFLYLPDRRYSRKLFNPLVLQDFAAIRDRNARYLNHAFSDFSWKTYNRYLKSNHIAAGIESYNGVTRLFAAIPRDARGLPVAKAVTQP